MKKWNLILPLGLAAAGAAALFLLKKPAAEGENKPAAEKKAAPPANGKEGSYSFISGFRDPLTVDAAITYDPEKFSFSVISEEFLNPSSDSHVAVLWGEDYHIQMEYAAYYPGEDFEAMSRAIAEKFKGFAPARYGENEAVRYLDGDSYGIRLRIPGDEHSYVQVLLFKAKGNDTPLPELAEDPDLTAMLSSIRFARH